MRAHAVIGANYGDEGKGVITDFLASKGAEMVVRFNGGAQAGHTVVVNEERRVHHHVGSGSLAGVPTFLSRFFIVNPLMFQSEGRKHGDLVYVDPRALVTTPMDMAINIHQSRYNTCGLGIHETMVRSKEAPITVESMLDSKAYDRALDFCIDRAKTLGVYDETDPLFSTRFHGHFLHAAAYFNSVVRRLRKPYGEDIIFEGAQGLMLDQDSPDFPYVTHSKTGLHNVIELCDDWGIKDIHATYVTRSYLTRHGAGPLPGETEVPPFVRDETNITNHHQGPLRYAPLDIMMLQRRIRADARVPFDIAVTCLDQTGDHILHQFSPPVRYASYGPSRSDVRELSYSQPDFGAGMAA